MNLELYNKVRSVPHEAKKPIGGGRLKGKTDINPMWRIKTLTEQFGACGTDWKYVVTDKRIESGANGEIAAFVDVNLYYKTNGEWSEAIPGTGGSMFVEKEKAGLYTSDECFKMALTDAISVACKALGIGADVYWEADRSKYGSRQPEQPTDPQPKAPTKQKLTKALQQELINLCIQQFGAENANQRFAEETGYKHPAHVPPDKVDEVRQILENSLPF